MSEEDLDLLITIDDPGEDSLEEDTFHVNPFKETSRVIDGQRTEVTVDGESA